MKKVLFCVAILLFVAGSRGTAAAQPQYYNYNATASGNMYPLNSPDGQDVQLLYLAGDFNQPAPAPAGDITSISFMLAGSLGPWTYSDLTIKMGQSEITSFSAGNFYPGSLTTVYYRSSVVLSGTGGQWMTIILDTPFAYDPAKSLIVDIGQCNVPGATGNSLASTYLTGKRRLWSNLGCPFTYDNYANSVYNMGITMSARPIPTLSQWGLIGLSFLLLAFGTFFVLKRRNPEAIV